MDRRQINLTTPQSFCQLLSKLTVSQPPAVTNLSEVSRRQLAQSDQEKCFQDRAGVIYKSVVQQTRAGPTTLPDQKLYRTMSDQFNYKQILGYET